MALKVTNTLGRKKEDFQPLDEGFVRMYVCGPTVYDNPHLGHAKSYVSFDIVLRYLRFSGYRVKYIQNITDVGHLTDDADQGEDKVEKRAARERVDPMELVEKYTRSYFADMDALNVIRPDISPRASGHVPEQIELVKTLIEKGYAYEANGSVYFDVSRFPAYGKLSGKKVEDLEAGARVEVNPEKRHPADFALWKNAAKGHILKWLSPWGWGFPGWHLECSAMSMRYLGETIDIHGGGLENVFPHHESEVAQSEAATGKPFVKYWLHHNMLMVNGVKMGKSLGNFITLKDAFRRHHPLVVRYFMLTVHYRTPVDYTEEAVDAAAKGLARIHNAVGAVRRALASPGLAASGPEDEAGLRRVEEHHGQFIEAMDDDFGTPQAIAVLSDMVRWTNTLFAEGKATRPVMERVSEAFNRLGGEVLGIVTDELLGEEGGAGAGGLEPRLIEYLINLRNQMRKAKNFAVSDDIRKRLSEMGVELKDGPEGTTWTRA